MKQIITFIILLCIFNMSNAQHTEAFNAMTLKVKAVDTIIIDIKFKDGKQKWKGKNTVYETDDYIYEFSVGEKIEYYNNGNVKTKLEYDNFGNLLSFFYFDKNGYLFYESKALLIDTEAKTIEEFLHSRKYTKVKSIDKEYRCSSGLSTTYLFAEGQKLNNKKIGTWIKYNEDGTIKKKKVH